MRSNFITKNSNNHGINEYFLLPFRFHRLNDNKEIIVNEVGDYLIVPIETISRIVEKRLDEIKDQELYADLISGFFISEEKIPPLIDVLATRYRTKKSFLDSFTGLHIFVITLRCNQSCQYCQVSRASEDQYSFDMSIKHIDKGIEMMMHSPNPSLTMEFQGGEPLLAFPNIQYAVEKTKQLAAFHNKEMTFVICTNLSLINDSILNYCKDNDILISTSLDGPEYIHNHNRRGHNNSYKRTIEGIKRSREILGRDRVSALMTASPYSLDYPIEIVEEYYRQGFRDIFLRPINPYGYATTNALQRNFEIENFIKFYKKALTRILEYNFNGEIFREIYTKIILEKILTPFNVGYVDLLSPAGIINKVIVFNHDGKVYASDESRMLAEMGDFTFQLGDLDKNSYNEIFYGSKTSEIALTWSNESLAGCSECAFQTYCGADPVRYYATQGDMYGYRPSSAHCIKNKEIINYLFELINDDINIEHIFRTWISKPVSKEYDTVKS
jgi:His-Xaa-Ser system radical SAM maturase HxsB